MAIERIPGVGPTNADIATAVAAPSAATIASTIATTPAVSAQITASVPTAAQIAAAVGTSFNPTNMTLQQTITSSSNNISTGRNFVYALVIGGGGGGAPGVSTIQAAQGSGAGGYAFGLTPSTSVVTIGAGGVAGNVANTANGTHNSTNGGQSRYGNIIANGGGAAGKYIGLQANSEEGWAVFGAGGAQSAAQAGTSGIDWASIAWRTNTQMTTTVKGGTFFDPQYYLGGEWGGDRADSVNRSGGRLVNVGFVGGGAGGTQYSAGNSFAGYSSLRFAGGAGALGTGGACAGGGGGGGWLGAGGAANAAVTNTGGTGGNGGSGGGGGGGGGADNTGNTGRAGGNGGAGCVILYY